VGGRFVEETRGGACFGIGLATQKKGEPGMRASGQTERPSRRGSKRGGVGITFALKILDAWGGGHAEFGKERGIYTTEGKRDKKCLTPIKTHEKKGPVKQTKTLRLNTL